MLLEVIIPAYRPDNRIFELIRRLRKQEQRPEKITVILTECDGYGPDMFNSLSGNDLCIKTVSVKDFGHGKTRQSAANASEAKFVLFMTQDALPADGFLTSRLLISLSDSRAAVAYARQLPYEDADPVEKYTRGYNYPAKSRSQSISDVEKLGIKAIFCSDTCAMYDMEVFRKLGGFDVTAQFNEDELYAYKAISNGYTIEYNSSACVLHSHSFTLRQQYKRYFDIAISQKEHPEVFEKLSCMSEGIIYAAKGTLYFVIRLRLISAFRFAAISIVKYAAYKKGHKQTVTGGRHED